MTEIFTTRSFNFNTKLLSLFRIKELSYLCTNLKEEGLFIFINRLKMIYSKWEWMLQNIIKMLKMFVILAEQKKDS